MSMVGSKEKKYLALSGGIGGAKLALGLSKVLKSHQLAIVANTGDDFEHLGLSISPDLDTLLYTLAELSNPEQGWGLAGENWNFLEALQTLGGETWFRLGDRDLATHVIRTQMLSGGKTLTEATLYLCNQLGIQATVFPMSDDPIPTLVETNTGDLLAFQHYFVRDRCQPIVRAFQFQGMEHAQPSPLFLQTLADPQLAAIVICPSNPFISIDPILSVPGIRQTLKNTVVPVIAISPIIGGDAVKGPTAKMMKELGLPVTTLTVANHYRDILKGLIIDTQDQDQILDIQSLNIEVLATNTLMRTLDDRVQLAEETLAFVERMLVNSK